jgi:hypothetical protein
MWEREFVLAPLREVCGPEELAAARELQPNPARQGRA